MKLIVILEATFWIITCWKIFIYFSYRDLQDIQSITQKEMFYLIWFDSNLFLSPMYYNLLKVNKKRRLMSSIISCIVSCRRFSKATIPLCNNDEHCFLATILDMLSSFFRNALKRFIWRVLRVLLLSFIYINCFSYSLQNQGSRCIILLNWIIFWHN